MNGFGSYTDRISAKGYNESNPRSSFQQGGCCDDYIYGLKLSSNYGMVAILPAIAGGSDEDLVAWNVASEEDLTRSTKKFWFSRVVPFHLNGMSKLS